MWPCGTVTRCLIRAGFSLSWSAHQKSHSGVDIEKAVLRKKEIIELLQSVITIAAIVVGGVWTYRLFIEQRELKPHLNIRHAVVARVISPGVAWVHLTVTLENTGASLISLHRADVRVQQILPVGPAIQAALNAGKTRVGRKNNLVPWPGLCRYVTTPDLDIEPKETDNVEFDFLIPADVRSIRVYTYLENASATSKTRRMGWKLGSIHDISEAKAYGKNQVPASANSGRIVNCRNDSG
jgi:hypothetical protein